MHAVAFSGVQLAHRIVRLRERISWSVLRTLSVPPPRDHLGERLTGPLVLVHRMALQLSVDDAVCVLSSTQAHL